MLYLVFALPSSRPDGTMMGPGNAYTAGMRPYIYFRGTAPGSQVSQGLGAEEDVSIWGP